jgi:hypothetical protein
MAQEWTLSMYFMLKEICTALLTKLYKFCLHCTWYINIVYYEMKSIFKLIHKRNDMKCYCEQTEANSFVISYPTLDTTLCDKVCQWPATSQ